MECFTVFVDGIEGRLDPFYYSKIFLENEKIIKSSKWNVKSLKKISKRIVDGPFGSQLKVEEYASKGIPLIRVKDVKNEELQEDDFVFITKEKQKQLKRSKVNPKDVILTKAGSIGNACVFPTHLQEANITSHLAKIEIKEGINPYYICNYLNTKFGRLQIFREGNKTTRPELNISEVSSILIPIPPPSIQNHIAVLMDKAHTSKKQKETEAQQLLDSINDYVLEELGIKFPELKDKMCYVVTADDVKNNRCDPYYYPPKFGKVEEAIKKGKYEIKFGYDLFESIESGKGVSPDQKQKEGIEYIEVNHLTKMNILDSDLFVSDSRNIKIVDTNDILTGRVGSIGNFAVFEKNRKVAFSDNILRIKVKVRANVYYLISVLNSILVKYQLDRSKKGSLQNVINQQTILNLKIPLPPLPIQNRIAEEIKARMQKAEQLQKEAKEVLEEAKARVERIILGEEEI